MNTYILNRFYSDTTQGTKGIFLKTWKDPSGQKWIKLYFGKNLTGQKLVKSYPVEVLDEVKN